MIDVWRDQVLAGDWAIAAARVAFIGLIYLFLFVVLRSTARELAAAVRMMPSGDGRLGQATLVVLEGADSAVSRGHAFGLLPTTVIGRDAGSDVVVGDPFVSAQHAELRFRRGQWWLRDLGSSNGTFLNGEPVQAVVVVRHGDVLQCGRVRFRFLLSTAVPIASASACLEG
jgi:pSer/pThr/pTyr-binding forkhead associated (FHA) protein